MTVIRWTEMAKVNYQLELLANNYLAYLEGNGRSEHTLKNFKRILERFEAFVRESGEEPNKEAICPEVVVAYRAKLAKQYELSSVRFHIQVLKAWPAYLTQEGIFRTDPLAKRGLLPKIPKPLPKFLTPEERQTVIEYLSKPDATSARNVAIFCLLLDTGLRISELASVRLSDIDWKRNEVKVWGKGSKERRVGFGKRTARYLRSYVDFYRSRVESEDLSEGMLFLAHGGHDRDGYETIGEPLSVHGMKLMFQRLSKRTGVKLNPHKLRHTFSTDFLNYGGSVADLQRLLGHETPQMSLYYAHITNRDAVERQKSNSVVDRQLRRVK